MQPSIRLLRKALYTPENRATLARPSRATSSSSTFASREQSGSAQAQFRAQLARPWKISFNWVLGAIN